MNIRKKNFIFVSESFDCEYCSFHNAKGDGFIRNHCFACLASKHLDLEVPGDRASECGGKMSPEQVFYNPDKGQMLVHVCEKCGKKIKNSLAPDDNMELVSKISAKGYVE